MPERSYNDQVDDSILAGAHRLARQRDRSLRQMIEGHREQCSLNLLESAGTDMVGYWQNRLDRCNALLGEPEDSALRKRALTALGRGE